MSVLATIRHRLGWKLGVSYLIVIAVAVLVMASAAQFHTTEALNHHMATMQALAGNNPAMQASLEAEGIKVENDQVVDFKKLFWDPSVELSL